MKTRTRIGLRLCLILSACLAAGLLAVAVPVPAEARPPGYGPRGPMMHGHRMHGPPRHGHWRRGHWMRPPRHHRVTERSIYVVGAPVVVAPVVPVAPVAAASPDVDAGRWLPSGYVYHSPDEWRRSYMGDGYRALPSGGVAVGVGSGVSTFVYHETRYDDFDLGRRYFLPRHLGHRHGWRGPGGRMHHGPFRGIHPRRPHGRR